MEAQAVEFTFADEDQEAVAAIMREEGAGEVDVITDAGILPVVALIVAGVMAVNALVNVIIRLVNVWKCGVVVDARGETIRIRKNCDLPRGSVLIFPKDGTVTTLKDSDLDVAGLLTALQKGN